MRRCQHSSRLVPIVYKGLIRPIRRESRQAICHWWGVGGWSVWVWRRALGIGPATDGTTRLRREYFHEPWADAAREKAWSKNQDPVRCAKISAAFKGRPKPQHVKEAIAAAQRGKVVSAETRRKQSEAWRRRSLLVPGLRAWTAAEDELVRTRSIAEVARLTGRTIVAVGSRRYRLRMTGMFGADEEHGDRQDRRGALKSNGATFSNPAVAAQ
jgi:hypothetical protein